MLKRLMMGLVCVAVAAPTLALDTSSLKQLNQQLAALLAPYQTDTSQASLVFKKILTDDAHALNLSLTADYKKTGPINTLELNVGRLRYTYGDGSAPSTQFNASLHLDLTKVIPQNELNQFIPDLQDQLQSLVKQFAEQYGDAAKITVKISNEHKDSQGNYVSLDADIHFTVDLDQLPQSTSRDSVLLTEARIHLSVDLTQKMEIRGTVYTNPEYEGFQQDQQGLKEYLDKLLNRDFETIQEIGSFYQELDGFAGKIVNGENPDFN